MKCKICGNENQNKTYDVPEMMFGYKDVFRYFQCSQCMCLQIEEFPADLARYYPHDYYSYEKKSRKHKLKQFMSSLRTRLGLSGSRLGRKMAAFVPSEGLYCLSLLPIERNVRILDIGCGAGKLLYTLREAGMERLLGIDPFNLQDITYENGLKILKKQVGDVDGEWDVVMFHHSFEHMPDPLNTLKTVAGLLAPGGWCVIRIPLVSSFAWQHYGINWVQLDAPRHFFLHSVASLNMLAEQAGMNISRVVYDSTSFQFWGSEQYLQGISLMDERSYSRNKAASIFSKKDITNFDKRADKMNEDRQGDQAIFYLRNSLNARNAAIA